MLPGEDRAARRVLLVCMAAGVTTLLDQSVLNIAVPALRQSLEASPTDVQWIVAGYSLTFGLMLVPGGSLGDVRGRKGLFLVGLSTFVLSGVVAATGGRPDMVIVARLVQGAGAGLVNSQVIGTLQDVFSGLDRARALGLYAVTGGVAAALGPALGGALVAAFGPELGWRLCLLLNTPCGLLTLWLAFRRLPAARRTGRRSRLDWWGLMWAGALTLALMLPFISTPGSGRGAALWAGAAVVLASCFVVGQRLRVRAGRAPLVHPALARSLPYTLGTGIAMASFGSSLAATLVLTMFLQSGLGLSALTAAAVTLPSAVAMGVASAGAWRVVRRLGPHTVTAGLGLGILALLAGAAAAVTAPRTALPLVLAAVQLLSGAAAGLTISPNQAQVLEHAPAEAAGVAGGILQMAQRIAAAVALSAVSGSYLRGSSGATGVPRTAFAHATLLCAGLLTVAVALSLLRPRLTGRRGPPPLPASGFRTPSARTRSQGTVMTLPPTTTVRWVTEDWDAPSPALLREQMSAELAPRYAPTAHRRVRPPQPRAEEIVVTWVAYADEVPVATASLRGLPDRHEVKRVFVHPDHRGRGLAKEALSAVESSALGLGIERLWLQTGEFQPEAQALYVREGWQQVPPYAPYDGNPFCFCYTKALKPLAR